MKKRKHKEQTLFDHQTMADMEKKPVPAEPVVDESDIKIVRKLNGQQFIDDFKHCSIIWVDKEGWGKCLPVQKIEVWALARGCEIRYTMYHREGYTHSIMVLY
jgi:hypothetical protein